MILLDPDLDPDPATAGALPRYSGKSAHVTNSGKHPIPSARALARFLYSAQRLVKLRGQVTILLTTDGGIRRLNREFRGKNSATDVLSFPAAEPRATRIAGDLAISIPTAQKQAASQGHTLSAEIKVLILHGLLHLAGYDHESDSGEMAHCERVFRARLRLPLGLIERVGIKSGPGARI